MLWLQSPQLKFRPMAKNRRAFLPEKLSEITPGRATIIYRIRTNPLRQGATAISNPR
ncbi:hypothetical protein ACO0K3_12210 [Undibacterium sp. Rencai35W]|uniref:hypothetical protein n=1 Tax=Undibacterium sp. Rencai35W TaxID=3413046 RepID=UPI003BF40B24